MTRAENSHRAAVLDSVLTCPNCGHEKSEQMPVDACQFFYECERCKTLLRPKPGHCCVFCSFGSVKCPAVQAQAPCCADGLRAIAGARQGPQLPRLNNRRSGARVVGLVASRR